MFEGDNTKVQVSKKEESIIEVLKERFLEERCEGDWRIPKGSLDERRMCRKTEGTKRLCPGERRTLSQDAQWGLVQMRGAGEDPEKVERST